MIKQTTLSILSALLLTSIVVSNNTLANTPEFSSAQQKTAGQRVGKRILSGLAHTALFASSAFVTFLALRETDWGHSYKNSFISAAFLATSLQGSYSGAEGIYNAIKNNPQIPSSPATKAALTKDALLALASGVVLDDIYSTWNWHRLDIVFNIPAVYCLFKCIKTFHRSAQQNKNSADLLEPEIHAITG